MTIKTLTYNQLSISEKDVYEAMGYHDGLSSASSEAPKPTPCSSAPAVLNSKPTSNG